VLGPPGEWRVVALDGVVSLSAERGRSGDTLVVVPTGGRENDWRVELVYGGGQALTTRVGGTVSAGGAGRLGWMPVPPVVHWWVEFRAVGDVPFEPDVPIVATIDTSRLDLTWYRPPTAGIPQSNVRTTARGTVTLAPGRYLLRTIADDAV